MENGTPHHLNDSDLHEAGSHLLDREIPHEYRREWTARIGGIRESDSPGTVSAMIFRLGEEWLALPASGFQEVVDQFVIRTVPHRTGGILLGLVNVRGELLLCIRLQVLLGQNSPPDTEQKLLVLESAGNRIAFPVDEIAGVHRYHPRDLLEVPTTVAKGEGSFTLGLLSWKDHAVGCLDENALFQAMNGRFA